MSPVLMLRAMALACAAVTVPLAAQAEDNPVFTLSPELISSEANEKQAPALAFMLARNWGGRHGHLALQAEGMRSLRDDVNAPKPMQASLEGGVALFDPVDCRFGDIVVPPPAPVVPEGTSPGAAISPAVEPVRPPEGNGPKDACWWGHTTLALSLSGEADERFDDRQHTYGLVLRTQLPYRATLELGYAAVAPANHEARERLLGRLAPFDRAHLEFSVATSAGSVLGAPLKLAYNYRYYREIDADRTIKTANLHRNRLASGRLMFLPTGSSRVTKFIGYTSGRLPFGIEDDSVLEAGAELKLL